jgi:hypothetical protein
VRLLLLLFAENRPLTLLLSGEGFLLAALLDPLFLPPVVVLLVNQPPAGCEMASKCTNNLVKNVFIMLDDCRFIGL